MSSKNYTTICDGFVTINYQLMKKIEKDNYNWYSNKKIKLRYKNCIYYKCLVLNKSLQIKLLQLDEEVE